MLYLLLKTELILTKMSFDETMAPFPFLLLPSFSIIKKRSKANIVKEIYGDK